MQFRFNSSHADALDQHSVLQHENPCVRHINSTGNDFTCDRCQYEGYTLNGKRLPAKVYSYATGGVFEAE
ncbi:hypothetical protein ACQ4M3_38885 [Leptolyngbya sp. AN03gr2]|uniref:hypothetical protein n=1 Tax=unclassified Leptolyngbya TaxID=2650499 RepID=UPI003D313ED8